MYNLPVTPKFEASQSMTLKSRQQGPIAKRWLHARRSKNAGAGAFGRHVMSRQSRACLGARNQPFWRAPCPAGAWRARAKLGSGTTGARGMRPGATVEGRSGGRCLQLTVLGVHPLALGCSFIKRQAASFFSLSPKPQISPLSFFIIISSPFLTHTFSSHRLGQSPIDRVVSSSPGDYYFWPPNLLVAHLHQIALCPPAIVSLFGEVPAAIAP